MPKKKKEPKRKPGRPRMMEGSQRIILFVAGEHVEEIDKLAELSGANRSEIVRQAIGEYLAKHK